MEVYFCNGQLYCNETHMYMCITPMYNDTQNLVASHKHNRGKEASPLKCIIYESIYIKYTGSLTYLCCLKSRSWQPCNKNMRGVYGKHVMFCFTFWVLVT